MRICPLIAGCAIALLPLAAAAQTGAISGTVRRSDTSATIAGARVEVVGFAEGEAQSFSANTNNAGFYTIAGLPPGTYYAWTEIGTGFINEIYDNIPCFGACISFEATLNGAPIAVVAGVTTTNRNFALAPGGSIRGIVTDQATGLPLSGVSVSIVRNFGGGGVTTVTTNASGQYTTLLGLATGSYYAYTSNGAGYLNEVYDNLDCGINCQNSPAILLATPIAVTAPAQTTGVNFALVKGATLSGVVTDAATGTALEGFNVAVANAQGQVLVSGSTDASGVFLAEGLPAGTYYAFTGNAEGYINEVYNNIPCVGQCTSVAGGTPIEVAASSVVTGLNFALTRGGRISGTVLAGGSLEPVSASVFIYSSTAALVTEADTDSSGAYISYAGLPAGSYYARVRNHDDVYVDEIYDNVACVDCQPYDVVTRGTPIAVAAGTATTGRNFLLSRGGSIAGRVTSAATGAGVSGVGVSAVGLGSGFYSADTDADGDYLIEGLPPGAYVLYTRTAPEDGLVDEIHDNMPCAVRCDESAARLKGTRVNVAIEATTAGINFVLGQAGTMHGTVTSAASGSPLPDVAIYVVSATFDATTLPAEYTSQSGTFTLTGLPAGSYYVYTENTSGFIDETFGNLPCLGGCPGAASLGTQVNVTSGVPSPGVDFVLDPGGRISGVVSDAVTSSGLASAAVDIVDAGGRLVQTAFGAFSGAYITPSGLAPGTYYASARVEDVNLSEVYGGAPCPGACSPETAVALGIPIVVTAGVTTPDRNFALNRGAHITGTVVDAGSGAPLPQLFDRPLSFYDSQGRFATIGFVDEDGAYVTSPAVPAGSYFGFTTSTTHRNEIYDDIPCPAGCEPSRAPAGTPIVVTAGATTAGRDFALLPRTGVPGVPTQVTFEPHPQGVLIAWQPPDTGGVAATYRLEAGLSPGTTAVSFVVSEPRFLAAGAPPGQFFVRIRAINASGTGAASPDAILVNGAGGPLPGAPTSARAWMLGSRLIMTWDDPGSGGVPTHYLVEAGSAAGLANIATIPVAKRAFTYTPVPGGFYFLRVRAVNATGASAPSNDVMLVVGGAAAPPRAPRDVGATAAGSTVSLSWSAPGGTVSGYVIEAGSAPGLSNLAVLPIGPVTAVSFPGIPPGRYYVRIRAVNALGRSVASNEMVIVVG